MRSFNTTRIILVFMAFVMIPQVNMAASEPSPDDAIRMLTEGNKRFVEGAPIHPNTFSARLRQAGTENQGDHAYATVLACSDSRVPVERIFDAGVIDIFVIRVAGNVADTDEIGSIEYGLAHVHTPVLVVLGHTQCGAVTTVARSIHGKAHALERNILPLLDNIIPAVERAIKRHPDVHGDAIVPYAITENVWQGIEDLFMKSPATRNLVTSGKVKVVGAVYDVGTGRVDWLPEVSVAQILKRVEANPNRAMDAMAIFGPGEKAAHGTEHGNAPVKWAEQVEAKAVRDTPADAQTMEILHGDNLKEAQEVHLAVKVTEFRPTQDPLAKNAKEFK